jgi:hypothetical protein
MSLCGRLWSPTSVAGKQFRLFPGNQVSQSRESFSAPRGEGPCAFQPHSILLVLHTSYKQRDERAVWDERMYAHVERTILQSHLRLPSKIHENGLDSCEH